MKLDDNMIQNYHQGFPTQAVETQGSKIDLINFTTGYQPDIST